ncbi:AsmA-like C-terminal region-containing protein [Algoriphagus sp. AGSA1]|uniref:AsmA-like C-terminal region-containing protein n=1 Tax=Algoriphagus sp. AGSA1 TaxID=2907213 RepID=UPI001F319616|nr:AsmA-like C-terminal region-containing protein [Algoriphagus sp. AGSA1]MCE7053583.1 AsmA-like C-terminal region-containing protein [Algoriphagus sp. AGSA1]
MKKKRVLYISLFLAVPILMFSTSVWVAYSKQKVLTRDALTAINKEFVGEFTIEDSYISPFVNFPYISIDLKGVKFFGSKAKENKPIYEAADFYIGFDVWDLIRGRYQVKKLRISGGHLDIIKFENGEINLLLAKGIKSDEKEVDEEAAEFAFDLSGIEIEGFDITYSDVSNNQDLVFHIDQLLSDFSLKGGHIYIDIVSDLVFDLDQDGENTFFADKKMHLDLELDYFEELQKLLISPSKVKLEDAVLALAGQVKVVDEGLDLELNLNGEKPDFNIFTAFLPNDAAQTLKRYKNEGEVYFSGSVRGIAGNGHSPAISVEFGADNAYFLNSGIQKKVDELRFIGFYTNGSERNLRTSELQLQNFYARPDEGVFQGRLTIRNFEDPNVKINVDADLDLGFLSDFFEIEGLKGIEGQVLLTMDFDELVDMDLTTTSISGVEGSLQSELTLKNLSIQIPEYDLPVRNANGYAYMRRGKVVLDSLSFQVGESDFAFSGELSDFPVLLHGNNLPIAATINARSSYLNLKELIPSDSGHTGMDEEISGFQIKLAFETTGKELYEYDYLPKGEFFIEDFYAKFKNYPHLLHDFHADVYIDDEFLEIKDFKGEIDESDFLFTGKVLNYKKWFKDKKVGDSSFDFNLVSNRIKLNDLLSYSGVNYLPEDYSNEVISNLNLKGKVDLHYQGDFQSADFYLEDLDGKMKIHPLKLEDFAGRVHYEKEYLTIDNFRGRMGISDFAVQLGYYLGEKDSVASPTEKSNYFHLTSQQMDLDALLGFESIETDTNHKEAFNVFQLPFSKMEFTTDIKKLNYHTFWLEDIIAKARTNEEHYLYLDTLVLGIADGSLGITGYFNGSNPDEIYFSSEMNADKLDLDKLLFKFENFGQDHLINENLHGKVSGKITSKFLVYPDLTPILDKSEATIDLTVYQGSLVNFAPLDAMANYFRDKNLNNVRFDTLSNTFELKGGVLTVPKMNINSSLGFIELSGSQSLDLNMDYFIRVPLALVTQVGFRSLFGGKNKNEIDPDQEDAIVYRDEDKRVRFVNINMKGTPDDYKISLKKEGK